MSLPFQVFVLGGVFHVLRLESDTDGGPKPTEEAIRNMPLERWFVMCGEETDVAPDALSVIDDDFKFRTFAYGRLETT